MSLFSAADPRPVSLARRLLEGAAFGAVLLATACQAPRPLALDPQEVVLVQPTTEAGVSDLPEEGDVVLVPGVGVTGSPDTFLLSGQLDYYLGPSLAIGPGFQVGLADDEFLVAPTLNWKYAFRAAEEGDLSRVRPFLQGGIGFAYIEKDRRNQSDEDDIGILLNGGAGVEVLLRNGLSVGTTFLVNFLPGEVANEDFYVSWHAIQLGLRF